jgi:hypothetical protein
VQSQPEAPSAGQTEADEQRRIQQLPPEIRALIPERPKLDTEKAQKDTAPRDRAMQTQRNWEDSRKKKMSAIAAPTVETSGAGLTSPSPSLTP